MNNCQPQSIVNMIRKRNYKLPDPKRIVFILLFCLSGLWFVSCSAIEEKKVSLGEREFCFDDKLTSLSVAPDDKLWIGTESGDVILFDETVGITRRWNLANSSVYKIASRITETKDTILYLGVRNAGLQIWRINGSSVSRTNYPIPARDNYYSVYDFEFSGDSLYVATSNGMYGLFSETAGEGMRLLLPSQEELDGVGGEFQIRNIEIIPENRVLVCSTPDGVKQYGLDDGQTETSLPGRDVDYVYPEGDSLMILSQGDLLVKHMGLSAVYQCPNNPRLYFRDVQDNAWLIASDRVRVGRNIEDDFEEILLRNTIPVHSGNIIVSGRDHTFLIVEDALWKIPQNLNIYESHRNITASCHVGESVYLMTNRNQLYRYKPGEQRAVSVCTFPRETPVQWMAADGDKLYLHTQTELYSIDLSRLNRRWRLTDVKWDRIFVSSDPIIAATITRSDQNSKHRIFLGTREALLFLNENGRVSPALDTVYVTSISQDTLSAGMPVYVTTLNHGVYKTENTYDGKQGNFKRVESLVGDDSPLRIAFTPGDTVRSYLLTTGGLYAQGDSLSIRGMYDMVAVNDTTALLAGNRGARLVTVDHGKIKGIRNLYHDVKFQPNGTLVLNDSTLMLAADIGALIVPVKHPEAPLWIGFVDYQFRENLILVGAFVFVILLMVFFLYRYFRKQNLKDRTVELAERLRYLQDKSVYLENVADGIPCCDPVLAQAVKELRQTLGEARVDLTYEQLNEFSAVFYDLYHRMLVLLRNEIREQHNQLLSVENEEATRLVLSLKEAGDGGNLSAMLENSIRSRDWLSRYNRLTEQVDRTIDQWKGCSAVEGVNEQLVTNLLDLKGQLRIEPLDTLCLRYEQICEQIRQIETPFARSRISAYIQGEIGRMKDDLSLLPVVNLLKKIQVTGDVGGRELLLALAQIEENSTICKTVRSIRERLSECLNQGGETGLLSDKERERIEKAGADIRRQIDEFYQLLPVSESEILSGLFPSKGGLTLPNKIVVLLFADKNLANKHLQTLLQNYRDLRFDKSRVLSLIREFSQQYESPVPATSVVAEMLIQIVS